MKELIQSIENDLLNFYLIENQASAADYVLSESEAGPSIFKILEQQGVDRNRAATLFHIHDRLDIIIYLSKKIRLDLEKKPPLAKLCNENLDAFCAIAEEVSHFHFIVNRIRTGQPFSLLEMEWQGEIDRFLSSSSLLKKQSGYDHAKHLLNIFYSKASFQCHNSLNERYADASHFAQKFISQSLATNNKHTLRTLYKKGWIEKIDRIRKGL